MNKITEYDKLIRDKIPEIIESHGKSCKISVLSDHEYKKYLYSKLQEEVDEFLEDEKRDSQLRTNIGTKRSPLEKDSSLEELADISEVILAILRLKGESADSLEKIRLEKLKKRGGFDKKLLLTRVIG